MFLAWLQNYYNDFLFMQGLKLSLVKHNSFDAVSYDVRAGL